jgi:hypothetical protein
VYAPEDWDWYWLHWEVARVESSIGVASVVEARRRVTTENIILGNVVEWLGFSEVDGDGSK